MVKKIQSYLSIIILLAATNLVALPSGHKEVTTKELRATPEEYSNRNIVINTYYQRFIPNFPAWLTFLGFEPAKYYYLKTAPASIPFLLRKKSSAGKSLMEIENKSKITVYGKVKKFHKVSIRRRKRWLASRPQYYLEVDKLELVKTPQKEKKKKNKPATNVKDYLRSNSDSILPAPKL